MVGLGVGLVLGYNGVTKSAAKSCEFRSHLCFSLDFTEPLTPDAHLIFTMVDGIDMLVDTLSMTLTIYTGLLIVRILLTWFPMIDWYNQPFQALSQITDPYLNLFRSFIPPLGGMDLSPILAIFVLQIAGSLIAGAM